MFERLQHQDNIVETSLDQSKYSNNYIQKLITGIRGMCFSSLQPKPQKTSMSIPNVTSNALKHFWTIILLFWLVSFGVILKNSIPCPEFFHWEATVRWINCVCVTYYTRQMSPVKKQFATNLECLFTLNTWVVITVWYNKRTTSATQYVILRIPNISTFQLLSQKETELPHKYISWIRK